MNNIFSFDEPNFHERKSFKVEKNEEEEKFRDFKEQQIKIREQIDLEKRYKSQLLEQQNQFLKQLEACKMETKTILSQQHKKYQQRETTLKIKIKEIHQSLQIKIKEIKKLKTTLQEIKVKYNEQKSKLKTEKIQNSLIGISVNSKNTFEEIDYDIGFGNDWFEEQEAIFYDYNEIKIDKVDFQNSFGQKEEPILFSKISMILNQIMDKKIIKVINFFLLKDDQRYVTSRFGSLIGTYFRIFRTLVLLNIAIGTFIFLCYIPHLLFRFFDDDQNFLKDYSSLLLSETSGNSSLTSFLIPPVLTFSSFRMESSMKLQNKIIYFLMVFPPFLVFSCALVLAIINELRISGKNGEDASLSLFHFGKKRNSNEKKKNLTSFLLNSMNHRKCSSKMKTLNMQYESLEDIRFILHKKNLEDKIESRTTFQRYFLIFRKIVGWLLILITVSLTWFLIILLNLKKEHISNKFAEITNTSTWISFFLVPTALTTINTVFPYLVVWITNNIEKWDYEENKVKVLIFRLYLLKVVTIILLCFQYGQYVYKNNLKDNGYCSFSYVGSEIFLLILMTFITEFSNGLWPVVYYFYMIFKEKLFDIKMRNFEEKNKFWGTITNAKNFLKKREKKVEDQKIGIEDDSLYFEENKTSNDDSFDFEEEIGVEQIEKELKQFSEIDKKDEDEKKSNSSDYCQKDNKEKLQHLKAKKFRKSDQKKVFQTYKKLISLLYFQVLIWLSLPIFPLGVTISAIFSIIIFKYQRYLLQFFYVKEKFPISSGDLGVFFVFFYILTYFIPLTMYYYLISVTKQSSGCGFSFSEEKSGVGSSIMTIYKDLGEQLFGDVFIFIYDHVINNTLLLYCLAIGSLVFFFGRETSVRRMKKLLKISNWKERREGILYDKKIFEKQMEIESLQTKLKKVNQYFKKIKNK